MNRGITSGKEALQNLAARANEGPCKHDHQNSSGCVDESAAEEKTEDAEDGDVETLIDKEIRQSVIRMRRGRLTGEEVIGGFGQLLSERRGSKENERDPDKNHNSPGF